MIQKKFKASPLDFLKEAKIFFKSPYFLVKTKPPERTYNRYAAVASASALRKSVDRHRFKRQVFAWASVSELPRGDYLFIARPMKKLPTKPALRSELHKLQSHE